VLVEIAEAAPLPAAECVVGQRHRDGHVDADHADLALGREVARRIAVAGIDGDAIAVFVVIHQLQALGGVLGAHYTQHGAKDLLLVDFHVGRHVVEQAAAEMKALFMALRMKRCADYGVRSSNATVESASNATISRSFDLIRDSTSCVEQLPIRSRITLGGGPNIRLMA